jgi:hypothetical protein
MVGPASKSLLIDGVRNPLLNLVPSPFTMLCMCHHTQCNNLERCTYTKQALAINLAVNCTPRGLTRSLHIPRTSSRSLSTQPLQNPPANQGCFLLDNNKRHFKHVPSPHKPATVCHPRASQHSRTAGHAAVAPSTASNEALHVAGGTRTRAVCPQNSPIPNHDPEPEVSNGSHWSLTPPHLPHSQCSWLLLIII